MAANRRAREFEAMDRVTEGRARLQEWLPRARALAETGGSIAVTHRSSLAKSQAPHLTEANLDAVLVYPAPLGGWHADVLLKLVPPGVPDVLGTPVGNPPATREEAERIGLGILAHILEESAANAAAPPSAAAPVFVLHGWAFDLDPSTLATIIALGAAFRPTPADAASETGRLLARLCPDGFDIEDFKTRWTDDDRRHLLAVLHGAAVCGLSVYPPRLDGAPVPAAPNADSTA